MTLPLALVRRPLRALLEWPTTAHHQARRNAMVALTECVRRRGEREEVERWLAARTPARSHERGADVGVEATAPTAGSVTVVSRRA